MKASNYQNYITLDRRSRFYKSGSPRRHLDRIRIQHHIHLSFEILQEFRKRKLHENRHLAEVLLSEYRLEEIPV